MAIAGRFSTIGGRAARQGGRPLATGLAIAGLTITSAAPAQAPGGPADANAKVSWTVAATAIPKNTRRAVITLRGSVREKWHIYALKQSATGPIPLAVAIEANDVASAGGGAAGSAPTVAFDPAFGFVTPYYERSFTLTVPVRLRAGLTPGRRTVPVSVRYQSCDGRVCEPPRTIRLAAPLDIATGA